MDEFTRKYKNMEEAARARKAWSKEGRKVVFTNGCFDILHFGHVQYLSRARSLGDRLIIGLNSDESVRRLKGPGRPVNDEFARAGVLSALEFVDLVVTFVEDTPLELIKALQPDVLAKGGDYTKEEVVGADVVESKGGRVEIIPFVKGFSTTSIIRKLKDRS